MELKNIFICNTMNEHESVVGQKSNIVTYLTLRICEYFAVHCPVLNKDPPVSEP